MGINVASSFTRNAPVAIDDRFTVADLTARDAIDAGVRYEGMFVYVVSEGANYQLVGGVANGNWEDFGSGGGGGGSSLQFYTVDDYSSPMSSFVGLTEAWGFEQVSNQYLFITQIVPKSWKPGDILKLKGGIFSADTTDDTKNVLIVGKTIAMAPGDPFPTAVTGGHDSTNAEVNPNANGGAFSSALSDIDLCDGSGEVNGTPLVPGVTPLVTVIYRDPSNETDSFAGTVKVIKNSFYLSLKD